MAKKLISKIKLQIPAGKANPSPPVGPALGQAGLNIMEFCKAFNAETQDLEAGQPVPVEISAYEDRSFTFITKTPPASFLIRKAIGVAKGSPMPNKNKVGKITTAQIRDIAEIKLKDMNAVSLEAAMESIKGSARAMGVDVIDG